MDGVPSHLIECLRSGGVIAFPTSTLPGLACLPEAPALDRLFSLKSRDADKPVSLGVSNLESAADLVHIHPHAKELLDSFPLGSITILLEAISPMDPRLGGEMIALRQLAHPVARRLVEEIGPVTATSCNLAGEEVRKDIVDAAASVGLGMDSILLGECPGGLPSTLIRFDSTSESSVIVMREGVVPLQDVMSWRPKER